MNATRMRDWLALAAFAGTCLAVSLLGGAVTATSVTGWYQALAKPFFTPPDWLFPPVWTAIFALIAVSGWRVWMRRGHALRRTALILFAAQLALNLLWSVLFFGLRLPVAALAEIVLLLALLVATVAVLRRVDRPAALLFLPYPAWVAYATALNAGIVWLN